MDVAVGQASVRTLVPTTVVLFNDAVLLAKELPKQSAATALPPKLRCGRAISQSAVCHLRCPRMPARTSVPLVWGGPSHQLAEAHPVHRSL
jgi:hypothetical protein